VTPLLDRQVYRQLDVEDTGPVYTFDIDKTYLDTQMSSARDLARIPFELAIDKRPYAGVAELIVACQRGSDSIGRDRPAFFVSASPHQMRAVLERRMEIDEIAVDGITLKRWGHFLRRGRLGALRHQVGYKLTALLTARAELPPGCQEILFGDDSEADSIIYSTYSAIVARKLPVADLPGELTRYGVGAAERTGVMEVLDALAPMLAKITTAVPVRHVFIHAVRDVQRPLIVEPRGVQPIRYVTPLYPAACLLRDGFIQGASFKKIYRAVRAGNAFVAAEACDLVEPILRESDPNWKDNLIGGDWLTP